MIRYEIKKLLGSKFIPIFFIIMFALNLLLSYYAAPLSRGELNLHSELDAETQAIVDEMYARYEADPETFMEEFSSCRAYYLTSIEMTSLVTEKNMEAMMRGEEGNYTIQDFWPEYNDEIRAKVDLYFNTYRYFYRVSGYVTEEYPALLKSVIDNAKLFQEEYLAYGMSADSYEYRYQSDVIDVYSVNKNLPIRFEDRKGWDMYFTYTDGNICMLLFILVLISLFVFDPQTNTCSAATDPNFTFQSGRGLGRYLYYTASDGALWQYDIDTEERKCLLKASLLNPEDGDVRFIVVGRAGTSHLMVLRQSVTANSVLYYDLSTGETMTKESFMDEETGELNAWNQTGQYFFLKHNTPAYKDDPHYTYYNDKVENWLVNYSGGEIWYRKSADDELTLLATLTTNDIPDAIRSIVAMDGKTLVVEYSTYEDFDNVYNGYQKITGINWELRYAVIDMETGIVYKNGAVYS